MQPTLGGVIVAVGILLLIAAKNDRLDAFVAFWRILTGEEKYGG